MFYSQETISEVKALNDIVDVVAGYVKLSPRSGNHFGLCPFHSEKTPSFSVNRDKQIFYCFGCGAGGNVVSFIKRIENMDFPDALKLLAERVHFNLPEKGTGSELAKKQAAARETAANLNKLAARFYYENLYTKNGANARKYLEERGVSEKLARRFGLGLAVDSWDGLLKEFPETPAADFEAAGLVKKGESGNFYDRFRGRLMFPIIDQRARVIGFGGRILDENEKGAKYLNSPETALFRKSECLYGLNLAKKARAAEIIVVEGYMDVIAMHAHGFSNTVGVLGTAMRGSHARLIKNAGAHTALLILDSDEAGIRAALRAIPVLTKEGLKVKILEIPDAKDPDEYLSRFGAAKFSQLLNTARVHIDFQLHLAIKKHNIETPEGKNDYINEAVEIIKTSDSEIEREIYIKKVEKETEVSFSTIYRKIEKSRGETSTDIEFLQDPRSKRTTPRGEDIGLKNAKKTLLNLMFSYENVAEALRETQIISAEEMGGGIFGQLLDFGLKNAVTAPSDVFDFFESDEDQQTIAEIFSESRNYPDKAAIQHALNDIVKKIKDTWLHQQIIQEKNDMNAVKSIQIQIKSINSLNITLRD